MSTGYSIKKTFFILISFITFSYSFSQDKFSNGYIITLKGDTIRGLVNNYNWEKDPRKILFKSNANEAPVIYTPINVKGFSVSNEIYESAFVETELSPSAMDKMKNEEALKIQSDTVFIQNLYKGNKSLYFYGNKAGKDQFYIKEDSNYILLIQKNYFQSDEGSGFIAENKKYLKQLQIYLNDCSTIENKLNGTDYNKRDLEKLYNYYYKNTNNKIERRNVVNPVKLEWGIVSGISVSSLAFKGKNAIPYLSEATFNQSTNFAGGISLNILFPRTHYKAGVYNELLYTSFKVSGDYNTITSPDFYTISTSTFKYSYIKLNTCLRYNFNVLHTLFNVSAGISNGIAVDVFNNRHLYIKQFSQIGEGDQTALTEAKNYELGYLVGAGIKLNKLSFNIRYEYGNGMSPIANLPSITNRLYFLLGYTIF